jgi:hypothetical protein
MDINNIYYKKYLKYKNKYLELKNLRGGGNEKITKIGKYFFRIMNKSMFKEYAIVNIYSSDISENLLDINIDKNIDNNEYNKFSAYVSNSNLSCWRLCHYTDTFFKGWRDYVQETMIHPLLQKYIYDNINNLSTVNEYFCDINKDDIPLHIINKERNITFGIFQDYNSIISCGREKINKTIKTYEDLKLNLDDFSEKLKEKYDCKKETDDEIYEHKVNNKDFSYNIKLKKVILTNKETKENLILYYSSIYIKKFFEIEFDPTEHYRIPTILTNDDNISKYGTFDKYISSGNYICKLFDYKRQCLPSDHGSKKSNHEYALIGDRYNDLFPFNELDRD